MHNCISGIGGEKSSFSQQEVMEGLTLLHDDRDFDPMVSHKGGRAVLNPLDKPRKRWGDLDRLNRKV